MTIEQFVYYDKIPARFHPSLPTNLLVNPTCREELLIARLLLGTLDVEDSFTGKRVRSNYNFESLDYHRNTSISLAQIRTYLEPDHTFNDFSNYLTNALRHGNIVLFRNLLLEITHFFFKTESKNHTSAFLHLYRALELISYSFPLYYASKSKSYHGTYNKLKDFFKSGGDGERAFLKDFVNNHLFGNEPLLDTRLAIKFNSTNPIIQKQHFDVTLKIANSSKASIEILDNTEYSEIITKRRSLISLMIATRNRHFHLLEGDFQENITSVQSYYFDEYFKDLNMIFCNWISQIFFKILHSAIEQEK